MGVGTIPWTAMVKCTQWYSLERDVAEAFIDVIREMDQAYVQYHADEQERNKVKKPQNT